MALPAPHASSGLCSSIRSAGMAEWAPRASGTLGSDVFFCLILPRLCFIMIIVLFVTITIAIIIPTVKNSCADENDDKMLKER